MFADRRPGRPPSRPDPGPAAHSDSGPASRHPFRSGFRPAFRSGLNRTFRSGLRRTFRHSVLVPLSAATLLATGTGAWYAYGGDGPPDPGTATVAPVAPVAERMNLPWPSEGQSSVEVEGIGSLGTTGKQSPVPIASVTKVMTAYVILRNHPMRAGAPGARLVADQQAADESYSSAESTFPVLAGREYTQRQLMEFMMVASANNVARLLARWDAGSQEAFVEKMNRTAAGLGMTHTTYTGASGIETSTKSTAADQLKLARAAMKDPAFRQIVATPTITAPGVGVPTRNTNKLLGRDGVIGLKTGSSTPAGGNLLWATTQEIAGTPRLILGVVLHQRADTNPATGSAAAHEASRTLISAVRDVLPPAVAQAPRPRKPPHPSTG
ncbi:D-alanyl-D-alanine carboxypeptidase family protein [Streptomyces sp. NPDC051018]|uniref:D-alanyl-D-alanine carboxypeptidase family protein n=1 Tax=Streptomyces sp. NPDC051018 TaxID=3365639 RepID=UPI0037B9EE58